MKNKVKINGKWYTKVNYDNMFNEIGNLLSYCNELDNTMPDYNSEVWQVAENAIRTLTQISQRAQRLENEFRKSK